MPPCPGVFYPGGNVRIHRQRSAPSADAGKRIKEKNTVRQYSWVCLRQYCAEIDEAARNRMEWIVPELEKRNGVTQQLKAESQMEWVPQMNACKAQAETIVKFKLIYD